jgi:tRNA-2-methylthio-N6-dimethylallyladenosine synthase
MEGCSKYCSFCVVPYTRGEECRGRRRRTDGIADLAGVSAKSAVGTNVNAYRGPMATGVIADLATLIEYLAEIDGLERIRYMTSHPKEMTQVLIDVYRLQLVLHLHLPVQSSDRILTVMKRGYTTSVKSIVRRLRDARAVVATSDLIVGFPGETEAIRKKP